MTLLRCKCGRNTNNGFLCTNCQKDLSMDTLTYEPEVPTDDETNEEVLDEIDFLILQELGEYEED